MRNVRNKRHGICVRRLELRTLALLAAAGVHSRAYAQFIEPGVEVVWQQQPGVPGDQFGWTLDAIGDITGDGVHEVVVAAPFSDELAAQAGKVWVFNGSTGQIIRTHAGTEANGWFGLRSCGAGDVNADGTPDYIIGAPGRASAGGPPNDPGLPFPGYAIVFSGADGEVIWRFDGDPDGDERLGGCAIGIGDISTPPDGHADLLVGAPSYDGAVENGGRLYLFSGADGTIIRTHEGQVETGLLGLAGGPIDDFDGDGVGDYVGGAPGEGPDTGGICHAYSGRTGQPLFDLDPSGVPGANPSEFGRALARKCGDVNGDGVAEIYIIDGWDNTNGVNGGRMYIYDGADAALILTLAEGHEPGAWFGSGGDIGDADGDGLDDFIAVAPGTSDAAYGGGRIDIRRGYDGQVIRTVTCDVDYHAFGYDGVGVGDVNGDGLGDYCVTAGWWLGNQPGIVYMIAGQLPCPADTDGNREVNIDDLFKVLSAWGPCDDCPEDISHDGLVDIDDVFAVLADWGPCE